jgi:addiction module RelE/StbE family toxin
VIVRWTPEAVKDRTAIWDYIAAENPGAAIRVDEAISKAAARLAAYPKLGKPGMISGTRELPLAQATYRLVYEIVPDAIWILAVVHNSRLWPP